MHIIEKKITELKPAEYNPRQIDKSAFEQLKKSLESFECVEPIVINTHEGRENIVVGGHQRLRAMKALKYKVVPCVEVNLPIEKEKELNIRLNKNTGDFDFDMLANNFDLEDLIDWGFDADDFDIGVDEVDLPELATGEKEPFQQMTFTLHDEQADIINKATREYKETDGYKYLETFGNESSNGNALYGIVQEWLVQKK